METIAEAQRYIHDHRFEGSNCPCCTRKIKVYRRVLNSAMVLPLIKLYRETMAHIQNGGHPDDFIDFQKWGRDDLAKLYHWDLVDRPPLENGRRWRITRLGVAFVNGKVAVPTHALIFLGKRESYSDETLMVEEALGNVFDFDDMTVTRHEGKAYAPFEKVTQDTFL